MSNEHVNEAMRPALEAIAAREEAAEPMPAVDLERMQAEVAERIHREQLIEEQEAPARSSLPYTPERRNGEWGVRESVPASHGLIACKSSLEARLWASRLNSAFRAGYGAALDKIDEAVSWIAKEQP